MEVIDLHGLSLEESKQKLMEKMNDAFEHQESVVRIIHGQGKHSETFPVIKSFVRHWLEDSIFAKQKVESIFRGEDGSPYTLPNAGETIVVLKVIGNKGKSNKMLDFDEEESREARRNSKGIRAERLRIARRRSPR